MSKFYLEINTGNDAFYPAPEPEIARILGDIAGKLVSGYEIDRLISDSNGNKIGYCSLLDGTVYGEVKHSDN